MSNTITIDGTTYTKNKSEYKKILKKYGYKWKGSYFNNVFKWVNEQLYEINADYERDNGTTISVTITLEGSDDFIQETINLFNVKITSKADIINEKYDKEIKYHTKMGAPEGFIKAINNKRQEELKENEI